MKKILITIWSLFALALYSCSNEEIKPIKLNEKKSTLGGGENLEYEDPKPPATTTEFVNSKYFNQAN